MSTGEIVYDEFGFDPDGVHRETGTGYDPNGFDVDGDHQRTGHEFGPDGLTRTGERYNLAGFDRFGYDAEGYDEDGYDSEGYNDEGYDSSGYNSEGYDCYGHSRCDNGDCQDDDCEQCGGLAACLDSYSTRAHTKHGWKADPEADPLYAGHEIEMYSDDNEPDDVRYTLRQVDKAYAKFKPLTSTGRCAIAKHDGSLDEYGEGGFELVTVPLTREQVYGIFGSFTTLGNGRCSAWDKGDDVGHHIHLSRRAIGPLTLGKLLVFMNADVNRPFLEAIAGREAGFNKFCRKRITDQENADRYEVLNVTASTVEFRLFKSNLYSKAILKNHEFAVAAVRFCEQAAHGYGEVDTSADPLHFVNFRKYVAVNRATYSFLHEYMLSHPAIRTGYRNNGGLPPNVANPKERSPKFALIRTTEMTGA
jgi:hypothetical protein